MGPEPVPGVLPALGPEPFGVFAPEVTPALQGVEADGDFVALLDRDGGLASRAAFRSGKRCLLERLAR